jgi:hypothetical protein
LIQNEVKESVELIRDDLAADGAGIASELPPEETLCDFLIGRVSLFHFGFHRFNFIIVSR